MITHYIEFDFRENKSAAHGVLVASFMANAHLALVNMFKCDDGTVRSNIGFGFPLYSKENMTLGGVVRAFGNESELKKFINLLPAQKGITDALIQLMPEVTEFTSFCRVQNNKSEAKLRRLIQHKDMTPAQIKDYRIKMIQHMMNYPYVDLLSKSSNRWFRLFIEKDSVWKFDYFDSYGLGLNTPSF